MPGFATYKGLATGNSETVAYYKTLQTTQAAGLWYSSWAQSGNPAAGSNPAGTPGVSYVGASGAVTFPDVSPQKRFLTQVMLVTAGQGTSVMIYDRLVGVGSIAINSTGNKTVNSVALPRYSGIDSLGVQAWIEFPSALTVSTALQISLSSYTNQNGVSGRSGAAISPVYTTVPAGSLFGPLPLQSGDLGVRSVEIGLGVAGTVPASGSVNLILIKPIVHLLGPVIQPHEHDYILMKTKLPRIYDGASLAFAAFSSSTVSGSYGGTLTTAWG